MKIDMHVHSEASLDSYSKLENICQSAQKKGIDAIIIADHNDYIGDEKVKRLYEKYNVQVFPSTEFSTEVGHVIACFTKGRVMLNRQNGIYNSNEVIAKTHELGGITILAHPYKDKCPKLDVIKKFDAVEVANSRCAYRKQKGEYLSEKAKIAGEAMNIITAGSDAHFPFEVGRSYVEINLNKPCTGEEIIEALKGKNIKIVSTPTHPCWVSLSRMLRCFKVGDFKSFPKSLAKFFYFAVITIFKKPYRRG